MAHRSGSKPWKVYDGDQFLAGCWTAIGAANTAWMHAHVKAQLDLPADTRLVCTITGASLAIGPHTPIAVVDAWVSEQSSAAVSVMLAGEPVNGPVH